MTGTNESTQERRKRTLTDADVEAIVAAGEKVILKRFYTNLGMGIWGLAWRAAVIGLVGLAAYGAWNGKH